MQEKTVYVAMSGGVDSSVAAYLLKKEGFRIVGVFMKPYQIPGMPCLWRADRQDALRVATALGIPLKTWDFSRQYGARVTRAMIKGYREGITPNPDVLCNKEIKFGLLYDRAMREGADAIATGHYAQIIRGTIRKAKDGNKDQTYFLWAIPAACIQKTLFPIGHLTKPKVRGIATAAGLITAGKKDSQGICFVGPMDVKSFLVKNIKPRRGRILHTDGRVIGTHDGAAYYTIGQRHGLDIKDGGGPYFVISKDIKRNIIVVGSEKDLYGSRARLTDTNWFGSRPAVGTRVQVKIRYRTPAHSAIIGPRNTLTFIRPVKAITPGQSAVLYKGNRLLGGGVIL